MFKATKLVLASVIVAGSATAALALPGPYYPGDHMFDYDPLNQSYEWQVNHDYGSHVANATPRASAPQGYRAYGQATVTHRGRVRASQAPTESYAAEPEASYGYVRSPYGGPMYGMENPWDKARRDDASEAGHGG